MTDSTISRLGSIGFTPPAPVSLGSRTRERGRERAVAKVEPVTHDSFDEAALATQVPPVSQPGPEPKPEAAVPAFAPTAIEPAASAAGAQPPAAPTENPVSLRKRIAFLLAAIAVPAMAAPGQIGAIPGAAPTEAEVFAALTKQKPMPFERAGMSFPGSAFFYVDDSSEERLVALPAADPSALGGEFGRNIGAMIDAGPAAAAFFVAGSSLSKARAQQCLAETIWYEAGTESEAGQRAVAQVVLNRVAHPRWPGSVCGVVYEGSERSTGCQFSFTCDGSLSRKAVGASWLRAQDIAAEALAGKVYAPIGLATHYHASFVNPSWAASLQHIGSIGAHRFYREPGAAGEKSAFTGTYSGIEPSVSGRIPLAPSGPASRQGSTALPSFPRITPTRSPARPAPVAEAISEQAPRPVASPPAAAPSGSPLADPGLRSAGQVKEQYSNAGQ